MEAHARPWSSPALRAVGATLLLVCAGGAVAGASAQPDQSAPAYRPGDIRFPSGASFVTPDGHIRIVGYNDMLGMMTALDGLFTAAHPGFAFDLVLDGTRTAPPALIDGRSAMAPMGAEFSAADRAAYRAALGANPLEIRVAHASLNPAARSGPLGIFVNRTNPLSTLTMDQAARIFSAGTDGSPITRWADLGLAGDWAARDLHPMGLAPETALGTFLSNHKFAGHPYAARFVGFPQSAEVIAHVGADKDAIGFAALNRATPEVKALAIAERPGMRPSSGSAEDVIAGRYPLDRYLYIYVRRLPGRPIDPFVREYLRLVLSRDGPRANAADSLG